VMMKQTPPTVPKAMPTLLALELEEKEVAAAPAFIVPPVEIGEVVALVENPKTVTVDVDVVVVPSTDRSTLLTRLGHVAFVNNTKNGGD